MQNYNYLCLGKNARLQLFATNVLFGFRSTCDGYGRGKKKVMSKAGEPNSEERGVCESKGRKKNRLKDVEASRFSFITKERTLRRTKPKHEHDFHLSVVLGVTF